MTPNSNPVGELQPIPRRRFVPKDQALAAFSGMGRIDYAELRAETDQLLDQDPTPRG